MNQVGVHKLAKALLLLFRRDPMMGKWSTRWKRQVQDPQASASKSQTARFDSRPFEPHATLQCHYSTVKFRSCRVIPSLSRICLQLADEMGKKSMAGGMDNGNGNGTGNVNASGDNQTTLILADNTSDNPSIAILEPTGCNFTSVVGDACDEQRSHSRRCCYLRR